MQHYTMHAKGTSFVQPNEARHIQTSVSGIRQKTRRTFPAGDEHLTGVAGTGARCALTANGGLTQGQLHFHDNAWRDEMPEICRFLGIVISMYFDEHDPPHFHVVYNEYRASVSIQTLNILNGSLPARVRGLVMEWAELHREELMTMWENQEFHKLPPLV